MSLHRLQESMRVRCMMHIINIIAFSWPICKLHRFCTSSTCCIAPVVSYGLISATVCVCWSQYWHSPKALICVFGGAAGLHDLLVPNLRSLIKKGAVGAACRLGACVCMHVCVYVYVCGACNYCKHLVMHLHALLQHDVY